MQAQWPSAPYVGIWTRATSFRRETLERQLARGTVVKATVIRQTLHLVTRRDYALFRAALSETNFPWESALAKPRAVGARARRSRPGDDGGALATSNGSTGSPASTARRAWRAPRARARPAPPRDGALAARAPRGGSSRSRSQRRTIPVEARAEIVRRYLAAFGPASRRDIVAWSMMHVPEIQRRSTCSSRCVRFRDEQGRELFDVPRAPLPDPRRPRPFASCRSGTTSCSPSPTGRACSPRSTGRR